MYSSPKPRKKVTFHSPVIQTALDYLSYPPNLRKSSETESTRAEVGTDDELSERIRTTPKIKSKGKTKEKMAATTDESSDATPEWTREEDRVICVMKSKANSWAEIGKALQRSRRECQHRHRTLASHAKELGISTEQLAKLYSDEDEDKGGKSKDNSEDKCKGKGKPKNCTTKSDSKPVNKSKSKSKKGKNEKEVCSDSDSDSSSEDDEVEAEEDLVAELWEQRRYFYDTVHVERYPDQKLLRPDRFYSESDCRILAGLEARYRADKWLHIQADFCNATGRMVDGSILKAKFYED
ncbi:hypothetical protein F4678DRAFT_13816 [Xylaria arbuscula]|nr:hypothetical protein F4678DRAFT_13816 [Xylaria arbuscula]